jgi:hypothetical protein
LLWQRWLPFLLLSDPLAFCPNSYSHSNARAFLCLLQFWFLSSHLPPLTKNIPICATALPLLHRCPSSAQTQFRSAQAARSSLGAQVQSMLPKQSKAAKRSLDSFWSALEQHKSSSGAAQLPGFISR